LSGRSLLVVSALVSLVALAGCYGSTLPATDVGVDSAVLNARGTTNNGSAQAWFEFWTTGLNAEQRTTVKRTIPDNASGPFSERVFGLRRGTQYQFRLCGNDVGKQPVCAQTVTLETEGGDRVVGSASSATVSLSLDVRSGPSGEAPHGTVEGSNSAGEKLHGGVYCLAVSGNSATVGFSYAISHGDVSENHTSFAHVVDTGQAGQDTVHVYNTTSTLPCSQYTPGQPNLRGDLTVTDSAPAP
jgi:hypothetical protein